MKYEICRAGWSTYVYDETGVVKIEYTTEELPKYEDPVGLSYKLRTFMEDFTFCRYKIGYSDGARIIVDMKVDYSGKGWNLRFLCNNYNSNAMFHRAIHPDVNVMIYGTNGDHFRMSLVVPALMVSYLYNLYSKKDFDGMMEALGHNFGKYSGNLFTELRNATSVVFKEWF